MATWSSRVTVFNIVSITWKSTLFLSSTVSRTKYCIAGKYRTDKAVVGAVVGAKDGKMRMFHELMNSGCQSFNTMVTPLQMVDNT